ncbi:MAG: type II CRISPR RNA-guided endonuclease Cas9, partial [Prevotella sp.]|nr:type II CRISPR RNA-guided endonuclease Cas9 [Prevotella sp.]
MKKILGLDLGTNSIGWAVVNADEANRENETTYLKPTSISAAGSRIIPMSADILGDFDKGNSVSQTSKRTDFRSIRRLLERNLQRRERLLRVLKLMGFLPEHFACQIDEFGKFINHGEPKLAWRKDEQGKFEFVFNDSFEEMLKEFALHQPQLVADGKKVPYDWTIYYLRKKALTQKITKEELAWILLQFNQKRGYYQLRGEEEEEKSNET